MAHDNLGGHPTLSCAGQAQAASGVDVNTGFAATVQESQRELSKLESETTLSDAELQAWGYRNQGRSTRRSPLTSPIF
jgi:hypothetical protein